jgi:hypothetical protein
MESLRAILPDQGVEYSVEKGNRLVLKKLNSDVKYAEAA